jgi:hypothetical protein
MIAMDLKAYLLRDEPNVDSMHHARDGFTKLGFVV